MRTMRGFFLCLCVLLISGPAFAEEKIEAFDVVISVNTDGDFTIEETIRVNVEGVNIRRGIFRDIPRFLEYRGRNLPQKIDVLSVTRDGKRERYDMDSVGNVKRIRIGDPDIFLDHRLHTYVITYEMDNQIRRDPEFDEILWNVTGSYWQFPIESASAKIIMPDGARLIGRKGFVGKYGSTEQNVSFGQSGEVYTARANRVLNVREGMSVELKFEKGVIAPEPKSTGVYLWWVENATKLILGGGFLGIFAFYLLSWFRVGKDPAKDPVFPRYFPPEGYSPGSVAHIYKRGMTGSETLIATLVSLATKDHLLIDAGKKTTTLTRLNPDQNKSALFDDEALLKKELFGSYKSDKLVLKKKYNARFTGAVNDLSSHLSKNFGAKYYKYNVLYITLGILMTIGAVVWGLSQLYGQSAANYLWILGALAILNVIFIFLMPAPTIRGQKMMAEIKGLRLFLKTAEKQQMDAVDIHGNQPPPMSVARYEQMLPYAIALGVEKPWSKHFEKTLPEQAENYDPHWRTGNYRDYGSISKMTDNMVSNLTSSAQNAQPQSSGSSSSGGGGFSGGGGGGGGGGGW